MTDLALIREALRDPTIAAFPDFADAVSDACMVASAFTSYKTGGS